MILLHTIALEPARWTPLKVSRPLIELLDPIREAGFTHLEVFEHHLVKAESEGALKGAFADRGLTPVILSSYLNLNPAVTGDEELGSQINALVDRVRFYGFSKVRLFPGPQMDPENASHINQFSTRFNLLTARLPDIEWLLETHDGSLADKPSTVVELIENQSSDNVGLLFQPTVFEPEAARAQFELQKPYIRHVHLQNRKPGGFETLEAGIVNWKEIIDGLQGAADFSLEFVPTGICSVEDFDLEKTLVELQSERAYIESLGA